MKILFYIEPHPIRGNALEYEWISKKLLTNVRQLNALPNIQARLFSNANIKTSIQKSTKTVNRLHLTFKEPDRLAYNEICAILAWGQEDISVWRDVYYGIGSFASFYKKTLEKIYIDFDFDVIITWGNSAICKEFCAQNNLFYIAMELGPIRLGLRDTIIADFEGVNGLSSTCNETEASINDIRVNNSAQADILRWHEDLYFLAGKPLSTAPYVLVALQLEDDSNSLFHSKFKSTIELISYVKKSPALKTKNIIYKLHPKCRNNSYNNAATELIIDHIKAHYPSDKIISENDKYSYIEHIKNAEWVIVNNSSMGFEAALLGRPVSCLSPNHYGGQFLFPKISEIENWTHKKQKNYAQVVAKLYSNLIEKNLYATDFAFTTVGILKIICDQCRRAEQDKTTDNKRESFDSIIYREETKSPTPLSFNVKQRSKLSGKIRTGVKLLIDNPRLFVHESKRRLKKLSAL